MQVANYRLVKKLHSRKVINWSTQDRSTNKLCLHRDVGQAKSVPALRTISSRLTTTYSNTSSATAARLKLLRQAPATTHESSLNTTVAVCRSKSYCFVRPRPCQNFLHKSGQALPNRTQGCSLRHALKLNHLTWRQVGQNVCKHLQAPSRRRTRIAQWIETAGLTTSQGLNRR